jgi:hypothetical protein
VALESQASLKLRNPSRDPSDSRSRADSQHRPHPDRAPPSGGWSTLPPTRDYSRPATRDSNPVTMTTTNGTAPLSPVSNNNSGMRDSVFRRFSMLKGKGVGRKNSRMDFKSALPEE